MKSRAFWITQHSVLQAFPPCCNTVVILFWNMWSKQVFQDPLYISCIFRELLSIFLFIYVSLQVLVSLILSWSLVTLLYCDEAGQDWLSLLMVFQICFSSLCGICNDCVSNDILIRGVSESSLGMIYLHVMSHSNRMLWRSGRMWPVCCSGYVAVQRFLSLVSMQGSKGSYLGIGRQRQLLQSYNGSTQYPLQ